MLTPYRLIQAAPIAQNPSQEFLQEQIDDLRDLSYDLVLAIGGGSVLDAGKIFAVIPRERETDLEIYLRGNFKIEKKPVASIAVPTTAGTGSEVTPYVSVQTRELKKISLCHPAFYPTVAIVDPELTYSMPSYVTASTGFDALSQAIESFWSVQSDDVSRKHSLKSLELLLASFEKVIQDPVDREARFDMAFGSSEAGVAIARAKTTAVHSVSYPITAHFRVPHGHACALTLSSFIRFNASVLKEWGRPLLQRFGATEYDSMAKRVEELMEAVGLERFLSKLGIDQEGIRLIVRDGFRPDRMLNNPRYVSSGDLNQILCSIYEANK